MLASERDPEGPPKPCTRCGVKAYNHEVLTSVDLETGVERNELACTPCADVLWEALG